MLPEFKLAEFKWNEARIKSDLNRSVGKGIAAAAIFLANRIREFLSVPAPRKITRGKDGVRYYRATTKATPGAPPRKLSGALRRSVGWILLERMTAARVGVFGGKEMAHQKPGTVGKYARKHERTDHKFISVMIEMWRPQLEAIIGRPFEMTDVRYGDG